MNLKSDNIELLQPFHTNCRNSDRIFASVLRKCFGDTCIRHLPFDISHILPDKKLVNDSGLISTSCKISDGLRFSIDEFYNKSITSEEELRSLRISLRDISKRCSNGHKEHFGRVNTRIILSNIKDIEPLYNENKHINKKWSENVELRMESRYKDFKIGYHHLVLWRLRTYPVKTN